mgnify:CR=1 FL=1
MRMLSHQVGILISFVADLIMKHAPLTIQELDISAILT